MWKDTIVGGGRRAIFLIRHHGAIIYSPTRMPSGDSRGEGIRRKSNPVERNIIICVVTEARDDEVQWGEIPGTH
jgi:hypothetical protein